MTIEEATSYILEGNAVLFLGAGFSYGAMNKADRSFPLGDELCRRLILDGQIDVSGDSEADRKDLGYISERYLEMERNTKNDLLKFMKKEFSCKSYGDEHKTIAGIRWKRIYTTNYDNIVETVSADIGMDRESVSPEKNSSEVLNCANAVIHMNGYVGDVTEAKLDSTFKLLTSSYQQRTIPNGDWAISLHNDILNAKCFICIGYSLDYDLELQQIFAACEEMKDKSIFVTWKPSRRAGMNMQRFGEIYDKGTAGFAAVLEAAAALSSVVEREYTLRCLRRMDSSAFVPATEVSDKDMTNLFFYGTIRMENLFSVHSAKYIIHRECVDKIINDITGDYRAVIIHSDIGNGKSVLARDLETQLANRGTVFYLDEIRSFLRDDLDYICSLRGVKYVFVENYNRIIDSEFAQLFAMYQRDDLRFLFTVRTYLNDNLYVRFLERFGIPENQITMYDVNAMSDEECKRMRGLLDRYSLWGRNSNWTSGEKLNYVRKKCNGEVKNVMLDLLRSDYMKSKVKDLIDVLFQDRDMKEITLLTFVCETVAIELRLDDIVLLLNKQVNMASILKNEAIREFFDFERNRIKLKSPLVAYHILQEYNYNSDIEDILRRVLPVLDRHSKTERYESMLRMLISYSSLRMIFSKKDVNYNQQFIRIYELSKTLKYHEENPFFWLQYAIARMALKEYKEAGIYLENAEAYSKKKYDKDSWQIETHKARLLLEQTTAENNKADAFINFEKAHLLLYYNKTPDTHYPLRQTMLYRPFYEKFYKGFTEDEKSRFLWYCIKMQEKVKEYMRTSNASAQRNRKKNQYMKEANDMFETMRKEMVRD